MIRTSYFHWAQVGHQRVTSCAFSSYCWECRYDGTMLDPPFLTFSLCTDGTGSPYATDLRTILRTMANLCKLVSFLTHLEVETILLGCRLDLSSDFNMVRGIAHQPRLNFGIVGLLKSYSPAFYSYSIVAYRSLIYDPL